MEKPDEGEIVGKSRKRRGKGWEGGWETKGASWQGDRERE